MANTHPPQHLVGAFVLTPAGWIHGILHLPVVKNLVEFLNAPEEFLKLTKVVLPGARPLQPFLALRKTAALLVVPSLDQGMEKITGSLGALSSSHHPVICLLSQGSVQGHLKLPKGTRISDFLQRHPGFIELLHCQMGATPLLKPDPSNSDTWPLVLLNSQSILGMTEPG
ncbi:MAG: hypothetical protein H6Q00_2873 [Holophagaceae bacterium]|nr:hypothetical protein [Holophagaceae bacterium]